MANWGQIRSLLTLPGTALPVRPGRLSILSFGLLVVMLLGSACSPSLEPVADSSASITITATVEQKPTLVQPTVNPTPVITETATTLPIPTATSTPAQSETATVSPSPIQTPTAELKGPLIGYRARPLDGGDELLILDIGSASYRSIVNELMTYPFPVKWHGNGCLLEMWNGALFDLKGNVVSKGLDLTLEILLAKEEGSVLDMTRLSPDRQWWAYIYGHGEQYEEFDTWSEFYDIALIDVEHPDEPIYITDDGVSDFFRWSADSQWIYYESTDEYGITQFYRYSPNNRQSEQLTFFEDHERRLFPRVSPDNRFLATAIYEVEGDVENNEDSDRVQPLLQIIDLSAMSMEEFLMETTDNSGMRMKPRSVWWSSNEPTVAVLGEDIDGNRLVFWIDATNGKIIDSLSADEFLWDGDTSINPAGSGDQLLLTNGEGEHYLFDRATRNMTLLPVERPEYIIYDMSLGPFDFPGEESCEY